MKLPFVLVLAGVCFSPSDVEAFAPEATFFKCTADPLKYIFAVENVVEEGRIYIPNVCEPKTVDDDYILVPFDTDECQIPSSTMPQISEPFYLFIQEFSTLNFATDKVYLAECNDTNNDGTLEKHIEPVDVSSVPINLRFDRTPTVTMSVIEESTDAVVTEGDIGTNVRLRLTMDSSDDLAIFGYKVHKVMATGSGSSVNFVHRQCIIYSDVVSSLSLPVSGVLDIPFTLVRISPNANVPNTQAVRITVVVILCKGSCTLKNCETKRRRREGNLDPVDYDYDADAADAAAADDDDEDAEQIETQSTILVNLPGIKRSLPPHHQDTVPTDECASAAPMTALLAASWGFTLVCLSVAAWIFVKFKTVNRTLRKNCKSEFSNRAFSDK